MKDDSGPIAYNRPMKTILWAALLAGGVYVYLHSCVKAGPIEGLSEPITKMEEGRKAAERKAGAADLAVYQAAVDQFKASEDRLPASFQELKEKGYISDIPTDLSYDPETGTVTAK